MGGQRQVRQPRRDGLRFVARRHAIEIALRQRRRVEEVRRREIREADVVHLRAAGSGRGAVRLSPSLTSPETLTNLPCAPELGTSLLVRTYGALNGSGNALKANPKLSSIVSPRSSAPDAKNGLRVLDGQVARLVVVERLHPGLEPDRVAGRRRADRRRAARAVLVRAVEAVEPVEQRVSLENAGSLVMMLIVPASASEPYSSVPAPLTISMRLIASGEMRPTSAPCRSVAWRAVLSRSPSTSTSSRVESSPRSRGRTPNGPLPTGVMLATLVSASPVDSVLACSIEPRVMVSTCSGIWRVSRSERAAVTLTCGAEARRARAARARRRRIGAARSRPCAPLRRSRACVTMTRYVPRHGRVDLKPAVRAGIGLGFLARGDAAQHDVAARQRGASHVGHDAADGGGEDGSGRKYGRQEHNDTLNR